MIQTKESEFSVKIKARVLARVVQLQSDSGAEHCNHVISKHKSIVVDVKLESSALDILTIVFDNFARKCSKDGFII